MIDPLLDSVLILSRGPDGSATLDTESWSAETIMTYPDVDDVLLPLLMITVPPEFITLSDDPAPMNTDPPIPPKLEPPTTDMEPAEDPDEEPVPTNTDPEAPDTEIGRAHV